MAILITLAFKGDALVWVLPTYRRFRRVVREMELATVSAVKTPTSERLTLGRIGVRRVPELFDTSLVSAEDISIRNCFGAIFLKDEILEEVVNTVRINAGIVVIATFFGGLWVALQPETVAKLTAADPVSFIFTFIQILFDSHLVLITELAVIGFYVIFLFHNRILLLRVMRQMRSQSHE